MENICIRFAGMDQNTGALFLQFSKPESVATIDQSTIHAFFPYQYDTNDTETLMQHMAHTGQMLLQQQQDIQNNHQFTQAQVDEFSKLIGACHTIEIDASVEPVKIENAGLSVLETANNPSGQLDQVRCIVLEILAEEGLIPGGINKTS